MPSKTEFKKLKDYAFDETFQKDLRMSAVRVQAGVGEGIVVEWAGGSSEVQGHDVRFGGRQGIAGRFVSVGTEDTTSEYVNLSPASAVWSVVGCMCFRVTEALFYVVVPVASL